MNKKTIITILFALVAMAGHGQVHYRLEGNIGDSTITGKAVVQDMYVHSGEIIDTVNITKGIIEPMEGELSDTTICRYARGQKNQFRQHPIPCILGRWHNGVRRENHAPSFSQRHHDMRRLYLVP